MVGVDYKWITNMFLSGFCGTIDISWRTFDTGSHSTAILANILYISWALNVHHNLLATYPLTLSTATVKSPVGGELIKILMAHKYFSQIN